MFIGRRRKRICPCCDCGSRCDISMTGRRRTATATIGIRHGISCIFPLCCTRHICRWHSKCSPRTYITNTIITRPIIKGFSAWRCTRISCSSDSITRIQTSRPSWCRTRTRTASICQPIGTYLRIL